MRFEWYLDKGNVTYISFSFFWNHYVLILCVHLLYNPYISHSTSSFIFRFVRLKYLRCLIASGCAMVLWVRQFRAINNTALHNCYISLKNWIHRELLSSKLRFPCLILFLSLAEGKWIVKAVRKEKVER